MVNLTGGVFSFRSGEEFIEAKLSRGGTPLSEPVAFNFTLWWYYFEHVLLGSHNSSVVPCIYYTSTGLLV